MATSRQNENQKITIRRADKRDAPLVLSYIKKIAEYEKMQDQVTAALSDIEKNVFEKGGAEVLIAEFDGAPAGFALYFYNFSTFKGKRGLHLEDIFVDQAMRKQGVGDALFKAVARRAQSEGCARMEWACLNWNSPSIDFYLSRGATPLDEWTTYRLDEKGIAAVCVGNE